MSAAHVKPAASQGEDKLAAAAEDFAETSFASGDIPSSQVVPSSQESNVGRMGYLANRRSTAPRPSQDEAEFESVPGSQTSSFGPQQTSGRRELKKSSSMVRLSMTSDGVARIVTQQDSSPSPPRKVPADIPSSSAPAVVQSDAPADTTDPTEGDNQTSSQGPKVLRRKPSGRSRDSRAWEFWCDRDARTELEEKAEQEASGSAADAIGLIRSNSGRHVLSSLPGGKRDSPFRENHAAKRPRHGRTPLLQRSQSVQNTQKARSGLGAAKFGTATPGKPTKAAVSGLGIRMPATDSDKENWSPERVFPTPDDSSARTIDVDALRRASVATKSSPQILGLSSAILPSLTPGAARYLADEDEAGDDADEEEEVADEENEEEEEEDPEVADFMGRGRQSKSNSVSEEEELDCVQGLLSLSQGNWR